MSVLTSTKPDLSISRIAVDDVELSVTSVGQGPVVLLVAGLGGRGAFWHKQIGLLSRHFHVLTFDHRGCGNSTPGKMTESVAQLAGDVLGLLDALEIDKVALVGHSTGGAIGQHLALDASHRLDRLVLSSSWPGPDTYFTELFRLRRSILEQCGPLDYLSSGTFLATPGDYLQAEIATAQSYMADRLAAFPGLEVELSRIDAVVRHDLRTRLPEIAVETLCIAAQDDQITPPGFTREMAGAIPGAELVLLEQGGHFAPMTVSDDYNAQLMSFLLGQNMKEQAA
jgi:aminoacrylate hydrolase